MPDTTAQYARYAVVGLGLIVVLSFAVGLATSTASFSAYNTAWDGSTNIEDIASSSQTDLTVATTVDSAYEQSDDSLVVVLSPDQSYTGAEQSQIRQFVVEGGTLLVSDDFGSHTAGLLRGVGARSRIDGRLLRDERRFYRTPNFTLASGTKNSTLVAPDQTLTLNHGSALRANGATVVATSSEFSYLDTNRNYALDDSEVLRSRPVVTRESIGEGAVLVVSDPSLFINAMSDRTGNRRFIRAVLQTHDRAIVDYSHTESVPPLFVGLFWLRATPPAQVAGGVLALGIAALLTTYRRSISPYLDDDPSAPTLDSDAVVAYLTAEHPEWDNADVRRMMTGVIPEQYKEDDDD